MKRKIKPKKSDTVFPLFSWAECCKCNVEFRREWGYSSYNNSGPERFLCFDCGVNRENAYKIFHTMFSDVRPKPVSPPRVK